MLTTTYAKIGQRAKSYRKQRGLSQDELAEGICSRQTISLLENGQHLPSIEFMEKIADRLAIPLHEILVDETKELETKVQLDLVKVYVERGEYNEALALVEELYQREDLLEYQRREVILGEAECLMRTGRAELAVERLDQLLQKLEQQRESDDHFMAALYDKLGTAYYFLSNITNAHAHYLRAFRLTQRFQVFDLTAARVTYNLGMACRLLNRNQDAIEYLSKAEKFFKTISDRKRLAHILFELGVAYQSRNDLEGAEQHLKASLAIYESQNILHFSRLVRESYAYTVLSAKDPTRAIAEMRSCAQEFEEEGNLAQVAYTYARLSNLLLQDGQVDEAKEILHRVMRDFTFKEAAMELRFVHVYETYSEYLFQIKDYSECVKYSFMASDLFGKMGYIRESADALSRSVHAYREQGMLDKALACAERVCVLLRLAQNKQ